jgi:hypothetical protein
MTNQISHETLAILAKVNEIDAALDGDLTVTERLQLQDELFRVHTRLRV